MATTQISSFAPDAAIGGSFGFASSTIALPGTPSADSIVRVLNLGPCHITVKLGTNATTVTQSTGLTIAAGQEIYLTLAGQTYLAGVAAGGPGNSSTVNIATGN